MESNRNWLLRRPRLSQDCRAERMDGQQAQINKEEFIFVSAVKM